MLIRQIITAIGPSIAYVPLSQGLFSLIDAADAELLKSMNWYAHWNPHAKCFYAGTNVKLEDGSKKTVWMHRLIMNPSMNLSVDHREVGNGLDNRRSNLRITDAFGQSRNRRGSHKSSSGLKGVNRHGRKWRAQIFISGENVSLGCFPEKEAAYEVYKAACLKQFGEFARP